MNTPFPLYKARTGNSEFELFKQFWISEDLSLLKQWIDKKYVTNFGKCNIESTKLRQEGNKKYAVKKIEESVELYTKSLHYAIYNSTAYGMALANRSAALFESKNYKNCLNDIELCLKSDYPDELRSKIYFRKAECYYYLGDTVAFNRILKFIKKSESNELKLNKLNCLGVKKSYNGVEVKFEDINKNVNFLSASTKIRLDFNKIKGRHVVANENIKVGDILFIEKAFVFASIYENDLLVQTKCSNCLCDIRNPIPCKSCIACFYCTENCRDANFNEFHRWECEGMCLWSDLGIGFPAFKCMLKGIKSGFKMFPNQPENHTKLFGNIDDNYSYFNSLISNIENMNNVTPLIIIAATVVLYLKNKTNFFSWLLTQENLPKQEIVELHIFIGGVLLRHMAQLYCNSSLIEHTDSKKYALHENTILSTDITKLNLLCNYNEACEKNPVASGIFPSVSIMNHSCKPNISMYFIKDTVIVKALEDIESNQEITNCYGIDYRYLKKSQRKESLKSQYYFYCNCVICSNIENEFDSRFNFYICPKCKSKVIKRLGKWECMNCKLLYPLNDYEKLEFKINNTCRDNFKDVENLLNEMESKLFKYHKYFHDFYEILLGLCYTKHDLKYCDKIKNKILDIIKNREGIYSKAYGFELLEVHQSKCNDDHCICDINPCNILNLYYPLKEVNIFLKYN